MTVGGIVAVGVLLVIVAFVIRGILGHKRHGDTSDNLDSWSGNDGSGD